MSFMFLLALATNMTSVADLEGIAHQPTTVASEPERRGMLVAGTPHGPIAIDGDANFSDAALLEGWPGDGSPENPFIIDGYDIDLGGGEGHCISIRNTRVSFTISNCNLNGAHQYAMWASAGICLMNVNNGELANNNCYSNTVGISLEESYYNNIAKNTCTSNGESGIYLSLSYNNTVSDNTCNNNGYGIYLDGSDSNTVANNTCSSNYRCGIALDESDSNTVANNTCNSNDIGIDFLASISNTVVNNTCNNNRIGISIDFSDSNTVENTTCNSNDIGIDLWSSNSNIVANNTCNNNRIGIYLYGSDWNTVVRNTCLKNTEHGIYLSDSDSNTLANNITEFNPVVLLLIGLAGITLLGSWKGGVKLRGWWKVYARRGPDDIIVPKRYRIASWFRKRRSIKHVVVDEPLEPDISD
jgi:parallel beta-helix repeat protein